MLWNIVVAWMVNEPLCPAGVQRSTSSCPSRRCPAPTAASSTTGYVDACWTAANAVSCLNRLKLRMIGSTMIESIGW